MSQDDEVANTAQADGTSGLHTDVAMWCIVCLVTFSCSLL